MTKLNVDCLNIIFNELQRDLKSLHSCLLVNKEWCNVAVPILWKKFSSCVWDDENRNESKKKIFNTILSCLSTSSKQLLSDNDIKLPSTILLKPPLLNYIRLCNFPRAHIMDGIIKMVLEKNVSEYKKNLLEQEIYKLFVSKCNNIKVLRWKTSQPLTLFPGASECFSRLRGLDVNVDLVNSDALCEMAKICKCLNKLTIENCYQDLPGLISLIDAQKNLKSILILPLNGTRKGNCEKLNKALARKGDTINFLYFGSGTVDNIPISFLTSLVNLKRLTIMIYTNDDDVGKKFRQYLSISKFPELEYLHVHELPYFKELATLIEKTNGNLLCVNSYTSDKATKGAGTLIKAIAKNCPKIKELSVRLEDKDFIYVKLLLLNCRYLKRVVIRICSSEHLNDDVGDDLLDNLTKFSPNSLTEIFISRGWKYSTDVFEQFFESCRDRSLHCFGFTYHDLNYITENHEVIIKRYIKEGVIKEFIK